MPDVPDDSSEAEKADRATVAEIALRMLDWMGDHKTTWDSSEGAWEMLRSLLPQKSAMCPFSRVKAILVAHLDGRLRKIDVCPCGYTVYMNCTSTAFLHRKYMNAHRTCCPRPQCGLSRTVPGIRPAKARKVMYYLGITEWCRDLYNRPDLIDHLRNDEECSPPGSIPQSRGWKSKMRDNPVMRADVRHLGLVGTADGVPYFKDKKARGGVPFMLRVGNLPPELQLELQNCHLAGLLPNEVFDIDPDTGELVRITTKNSTLYPILLALADELCNLYVTGARVADATKPVGHPDRFFTLRVLLLFWYVFVFALRL